MKSTFLQIQHPQNIENFSCDLQSCVLTNDKVYYSVRFNDNIMCVYQFNLSMLLVNTDSQQHVLSLPPAIMWPIDDPTIYL